MYNKVPGTLTHTYTNKHVCICGHVTLAESSLECCFTQEAALTKKINCCYAEQWQNVVILLTTWQWARLVNDVISSYTSIEIPTLFQVSSRIVPLTLFKSLSCMICTVNFQLLEPHLPARNYLSCREPLFVSDYQVCDL